MMRISMEPDTIITTESCLTIIESHYKKLKYNKSTISIALHSSYGKINRVLNFPGETFQFHTCLIRLAANRRKKLFIEIHFILYFSSLNVKLCLNHNDAK